MGWLRLPLRAEWRIKSELALQTGRTADCFIDLINTDMLYFTCILNLANGRRSIGPDDTLYRPGGFPAVFAEVGC